MGANYEKRIPYNVPHNTQMAVIELSKVIGIPINYKLIRDEQYVTLLSGIILYRHLDRLEREDVMARIYQLEDRRLQGKLVDIVTQNIVNPLAGMWSMSDKEINEYLSVNKEILDWFTIAGINPGAVGVAQGTWEAIKTGGKGGGLMIAISLVMLGINYGISKEADALQNELDKRRVSINPNY